MRWIADELGRWIRATFYIFLIFLVLGAFLP